MDYNEFLTISKYTFITVEVLETERDDYVFTLADTLCLSLIPLGKYGEVNEELIQRFGSQEDCLLKFPKTPRYSWKEFQTKPASIDTVSHWIRTHPGTNYGVVCGPIVGLDADDYATALWIETNITRTPWRVKTSKGMHYYFHQNEKIPLKNSVNHAAKLDIRSHGGYLVAPGSRHPDGSYYELQQRSDGGVTSWHDLPALTIEDIQKINEYIRSHSGNTVPPLSQDLPKSGFAFNAIPTINALFPVEKGSRNNTLARLAGQWFRAGRSVQETVYLCRCWNDDNPEPLSTAELMRAINSIYMLHERNHPDMPVPLLMDHIADPEGYDAAANYQSKTHKRKHASEYMNQIDLYPQPVGLINNYLMPDSLALLFGTSGHGKSFVAVDWACSVACGVDWMGNRIGHEGHVLYVAGESRNGLVRRAAGWAVAQGLDWRSMPLAFTTGPTRLTEADWVADLIQLAKEDMKAMPVLIVLDTLNRNFGQGDENSTEDMTRYVAGLDALRAATGACVLSVHHNGHGEKGRARGSSVLRAAMDSEFCCAREDDGTIVLTCTKQKEIDAPPTLAMRLQKVAWQDEKGQDFATCVLDVDATHGGPSAAHGASVVAGLDAAREAAERPECLSGEGGRPKSPHMAGKGQDSAALAMANVQKMVDFFRAMIVAAPPEIQRLTIPRAEAIQYIRDQTGVASKTAYRLLDRLTQSAPFLYLDDDYLIVLA